MILNVPKPPKIYALGHRFNRNILDGPTIEITEKLDGSQFRFGLLDGALIVGTKNTLLNPENPQNKMFNSAVEIVRELFTNNLLADNTMFYGECLCSNRQNVLRYDRMPKGHIALFGGYDINEDKYLSYSRISGLASIFGIDVVPMVYKGPAEKISRDPLSHIEQFLSNESALGGCKCEGIVIRNVHQITQSPDAVYDYTIAKYVSEKFKEVANVSSKKKGSGWHDFCTEYRTEARWQKAVQYLRESGELTGDVRDIGPLIRRVHDDITEEDHERIKQRLWEFYRRDLMREATRGLPEWYKQKLVEDLDDGK
jgi:hypothetical protein